MKTKKHEYTITLNYKVMNCLNCPFKQTHVFYEGFGDAYTKLSGTVSIKRQNAICALSGKELTTPIPTESYNSECPLYKKCKEVEVEE